MSDEAPTKALLNGLVCGASSRACDRGKILAQCFSHVMRVGEGN